MKVLDLSANYPRLPYCPGSLACLVPAKLAPTAGHKVALLHLQVIFEAAPNGMATRGHYWTSPLFSTWSNAAIHRLEWE